MHSVGWANLDTFRQSRQLSSALGVGPHHGVDHCREPYCLVIIAPQKMTALEVEGLW